MSASERLPAAHVVHAVRGRTRLIVPTRRGDGAFFAHAAAVLGALPAVAAATASPRAGSLVVRHEGGFDAVAAAAQAAGVFEVLSPPAAAPHRPPRSHRPPRKVTPLALAAGGLAGLGAVQVLRGRLAGSAVEALWHADQAQRRLGMPVLSRVMIGVGLMQLVRGQVLGPASSLLFYALSARQMARDRRQSMIGSS